MKPLRTGFSLPVNDLGSALEALGIKLFPRERTLVQYVSWSLNVNVFGFLEQAGEATKDEIAAGTQLTEAGADSLLGVLCALKVLSRTADGKYRLGAIARDFLLESSPYYLGDQLDAAGPPIPGAYLRTRASLLNSLKVRLLSLSPSIRYGSRQRLANQHARNLGACASAVRTGEFSAVSLMIDIAGGSGSFSIPLALDHPEIRIILTDLPAALEGSRMFLEAHALEHRVELLGQNALQFPWHLPECDGMFIGNFLHGFDDAVCRNVLKEALRCLAVGGKLWIHEMLWNDNRDGPLITALWHAAMRGAGPGRKRSVSELSLLLEEAGFLDIRARSTSGAYALVSGAKMAV